MPIYGSPNSAQASPIEAEPMNGSRIGPSMTRNRSRISATGLAAMCRFTRGTG